MRQNCKKLKAKIDDLSTDCDVGSWTWHDSMDNILEEFTSKLIHQAKQEERERIKQNIGQLRQWLNERTEDRLINNKDIETFLNK